MIGARTDFLHTELVALLLRHAHKTDVPICPKSNVAQILSISEAVLLFQIQSNDACQTVKSDHENAPLALNVATKWIPLLTFCRHEALDCVHVRQRRVHDGSRLSGPRQSKRITGRNPTWRQRGVRPGTLLDLNLRKHCQAVLRGMLPGCTCARNDPGTLARGGGGCVCTPLTSNAVR